ncbi:MAG: alpha/beta fold hydrolase [Pseudomonadota bacterium]
MTPAVSPDLGEVSLHNLLERLYDAAVDDSRVPAVIEALSTFMRANPPHAEVEIASRHFERAGQLARKRNLLDGIPIPALHLDESGVVLAANPLACPFVEELAPESRLGICRADQGAICRALKDLARGRGNGRTLFLAGRNGETHHVHLLQADPLELNGFVALLVSAWLPQRYMAVVQSTFGLSAAEARVAITLATGKSVNDIAALLCVSRNTVRTHLAAAFSKTDTHGQPELVARVLQCVFGLGRVEALPGVAAIHPLAAAPPQFLDVGAGRKLAWREYGDPNGWPVLVTHGFGDCGLQREAESRIAARYGIRLICPDRPGIGRSDPASGSSLQDYGVDLGQLVATLALPKLDVMGLSFGALDAVLTATQLGHKCNRLLLVSPVLPRSDAAGAGRGFAVLMQILWRSDLLVDAYLRLVHKLVVSRGFVYFHEKLGRTAPCDFEAMREDPEIVARLEAGLLESVRQGVAPAREFLRLHGQADPAIWADYAGPTVVWQGALDEETPLALVQQQLAAMKDVCWHLEPDLGHRLYFLAFEKIMQDIHKNHPNG